MQTCAILEPEKESTSKEERPMKKVLILSGSPRKGGNSDLLCSEFMRGAQESGNEVQKIFVRSKKIVDYRLSPYTQEEGALDVARAVRFVRQNADVYGIDPDDIAVMGFSAGGIQAGEFLMHYDEDVNGTALDESYVPDALDAVPAHASAAGMIYSFYGRLSVGNMDPDWLAEGDLPPTFYVYGTEDPFYRQFQQQYDVIRNMGISAGRIVLNSWPHGFGSDGGWVNDYAAWLESVFANKEES